MISIYIYNVIVLSIFLSHIKERQKCERKEQELTILFTKIPNKKQFFHNGIFICNKIYFIIEQQIAWHFVHYSEYLYYPSPSPLLCNSND